MFRNTQLNLLRMPKGRRTKERYFEVMNLKNFGFKEGASNMKVGLFIGCITTSFFVMEARYQWQRLRARGDTCPACEQMLLQRRIRAEHLEKGLG